TFIEYSYLIKKVNFKISILPIVKIFSTMFVHVIFLSVVVIILLVSKIPFSFYWFQFIYYLFCVFMLVLGLGWLLSSLTVFIRDVTQVVTIVLSFGMWLTPIFWDVGGMKGKFKYVLMANPMTYITEGYRKSFIYNTPFWDNPLWTAYFWGFTIVILFLGIFVFRKLKPHFADVL
ncbi:MAG TPA: ABC transporter permease, partial [Spirochaetota bacterium]|nr:ABC transporter permease [Spirochaetota bacterium]